MAGCSFSSPDQCVSDLATSALGQMAKSFADSASYALTKCTEVWLRVPSPDVTSGSSPSAWLSSQLNAFVLAVMFVSVLYSAYRMATSGTFDHVGELGKSLARLFVVSGVVGVATTTGLSMGDAVANWVLTGTRAHLGTLVVITPAMSPALSVILSATVIVGAVVQAVLMLIKNAMVVILVGFMPLTSAATNTPVGQGSFLKALTWLAAMVAYKPVAAIIYALAFKLSDRRQDMAAQLSGIAFMVLAIVALPALMRFLAPVAAAATGGSAGAISGAIVGGTVATGAVIGAGLITGGGGFAAAAPAAMSAAPSGAQTGAAPAATGTTTTEPDQEAAA